MKETRCPSCGYTKKDAAINGDHNLCKNAGNAPWEKRAGVAPSRSPAEQEELKPHSSQIHTDLKVRCHNCKGTVIFRYLQELDEIEIFHGPCSKAGVAGAGPSEREAFEAFQSWAMGKQAGIPFPYAALELDKVSFNRIKFKDDLTQAFFVVWNAAWQARAAVPQAAAKLVSLLNILAIKADPKFAEKHVWSWDEAAEVIERKLAAAVPAPATQGMTKSPCEPGCKCGATPKEG